MLVPALRHYLVVLICSRRWTIGHLKKQQCFLIVQSDMPFIKKTHLNKIYNSLLYNRYSVHLLRFKNKIGNPIGFNISVINKFKPISFENTKNSL